MRRSILSEYHYSDFYAYGQLGPAYLTRKYQGRIVGKKGSTSAIGYIRSIEKETDNKYYAIIGWIRTSKGTPTRVPVNEVIDSEQYSINLETEIRYRKRNIEAIQRKIREYELALEKNNRIIEQGKAGRLI